MVDPNVVDEQTKRDCTPPRPRDVQPLLQLRVMAA
jgi:hypothetical protein